MNNHDVGEFPDTMMRTRRDHAKLLTLIERFDEKRDQQSWPEHPLFGKLSGKDWAALSYKHFNHHLRQFGV